MQHTRVIFSAEQAAAALWTYGEDTLVDAALRLSRGELELVWSIAASAYELSPAAVAHPPPAPGVRGPEPGSRGTPHR